MAKYLARSCPMFKQYMGMAIANEIGKRPYPWTLLYLWIRDRLGVAAVIS